MNGVIRSVLDWFSVYLIPTVIGLMTVITLVLAPSHQGHEGTPLSLRVLEDSSSNLTLQQALQGLAAKPQVDFEESNLSEAPFWLLFDLPPKAGVESVVEFPVPHSMALACWDAKTLEVLGQGTRDGTSGLISLARGGFALESSKLANTSSLLCRIRSAGPSRMSVSSWNATDFAAAVESFRRSTGLLDGGLCVLALFVFLTAIINRQEVYVIYAAWLFGNLRLAGLGSGADTMWLGSPIPMDWLNPMHQLTMSCYYVLTVTLFNRVFSTDLKRVGLVSMQRWNQWTCPVVLAMLLLPYQQYLPLLWVMAGIVCVNIATLLTRLIFVTRSKVAVWFSLAFIVVLFSTFSEVVAVAFGITSLLGAANFVTSSLVASLMAALAIAQQMRDERLERLRAENALRDTYQEIPMGLFTLDHGGSFLRANPMLGDMLGHEVHDGTRHWKDYFGEGYWQALSEGAYNGKTVEMEVHDIHAPESNQWFLLRAKRAGDRIEGSLQDISDRVKATSKLTFLADHDPLTGVFNRRGIEKCLSDAIAETNAELRCLLAYIDLDRFKLINDLYGHACGDEVLRQICLRIAPVLEEREFFGRVGGDEFVIVFRRGTLANAADSCRQLISLIESTPYEIGDKAFRVGGSVGLVEVGTEMSVEDAIAGADQACRQAKKGSGGELVVYEKDSPAFHEREHELHILKRFGVDTVPDGLFVVMQPIMSLHAPYDSLNFEVLLRMYRPDNSVEPAWRVINTAEKNGRIALIDRWVLKTTLEWLDVNLNALERTRFVSVNLSGGSLNDERFVEDAFALLAQHPRSASRLCFEITESVAVSDIENTLRFVNRAREFGAKIALDDFGVGYTSFSYLHSLSADVLKIDGSLVSATLAHPANMSIIEAIANLSSNLGMTTIAEWAGDLDTVKAMVEVGVDYVQSYAVGRPQMPESIAAARSAADFIQDQQIEEYVRKRLVLGIHDDAWPLYRRRKEDLH